MKSASNIYHRLLVVLFASIAPIAVSAQPKLDNPLTSDSILCFIDDIIGALTYLAIPIIVLFIIVSGFKFVTAGGNESDLQDAKQMALYTLVGAAIILGADLISSVLINTATNLGVSIGGATCS